MRLLLLLALAACVAPDDSPPDSVQIQGNVIGTFHVLTSFVGDTPSTLLTMGVSELSTGCPSLTLDTAAVGMDSAAPLPMQRDDQGDYTLLVDASASQFVFDGAQGGDSIEATATAPDPFEITYTDGGPGDPIHVSWTVDSSPDDIEVQVEGDFGWYSLPRDTGELVIPGSAVRTSGDLLVSKMRKTGWCASYDRSGGDSHGCCGSWSAEAQRTAPITVP